MRKSDIVDLLKSRRFLPIFLTQLFGAFNDNFYKTALLVFVGWNISGEISTYNPVKTSILIMLAQAIFIFPFFIFSGTGGQLADRYNKAKLMRIIKFFEIPIAILAIIGFMSNHVSLLFITLFLLAVQFSFFGPVKYSILPSHLKNEELLAGNGLIEGATFVAILIAMMAGTSLVSIPKAGPILAGFLSLILAITGWIASFYVLDTGVAAPHLKVNWNFLGETLNIIQYVRKKETIFSTILGVSWFWLVGSCYLTLLIPYTRQTVHAEPSVFVLFLTVFTIGIAIGSLATNYFLKGKVDVKYVPPGVMGMSVFMLLVVLATRYVPHYDTLINLFTFLKQGSSWFILSGLFGLAVCGGFFIVPLNTSLQTLPKEEYISRVVAANNVLNALFMVAAALVCILLITLKFTIPFIFLLLALANIYVGWKIICIVPDAALQSFARWFFQLLYRVEIKGMENYKKAGNRVLIIPNHVSFIDPCFLVPFLPDKLTFAIDTFQAQRWWIKPLLKLVNAFPIDPANPMSLKSLVAILRKNKKVVIFPEGRITVTGSLMKIYEGPGLIADKAKATLLPIRIDGPQYSPFSRLKGKVRLRWFPKVTITILPPEKINVPEEIKGHERRSIISERLHQIMTKMMYETEKYDQNLFEAVIEAKAIHGAKHPIIVDVKSIPLNYRQLLTKAFALGQYISKITEKQENVGIMLPNANAAIVTFFACQSMGRVPAMLNFTSGLNNLRSAVKAAQIKTILSSRHFIEQANLQEVANALSKETQLIYLEDVKTKISMMDKLLGFVGGYFSTKVYQLTKTTSLPDDPAVILFTSGTENTPKGVVLSHKNILGNCAQVLARVDFNAQDRLFNALPLFHSFGLTGGMILPIINGIRTFFYPSPLHYRIVPEQVYSETATIMFGTDTFLSGYAKYAHPYDFYSIRYVFAGAEKLKEETRRTWMEKFGVRIFEGYGVTEASPIVSVNTPMYYKPGTVGRLLPGIEYKLESVDGIEKGGQLWLKGINVMKGYLKEENPGQLLSLSDGWYDTGDIVSLDEDGFIKIEGRVKRFAKIGGEMVSLGAVEEFIHQLWPDQQHAVVNLPDPKKGEMLVLLTTINQDIRETMIARAKEKGISEIMLPKRIIMVNELPLLGSGKIDYRAVKKIAEETV